MVMTSFLPQPGTRYYDRFIIREQVGLGPIAGVFRATDTALQKEVILKVFYPGLASARARDVNLFRIFRARAFLHKNILPVQEVFSGDDYLFVTKDIIDCVSLRTLQALKREALEPFAKKEIANLIFELCEALKMVHLLGTNGNLKPENILLSDDGLRIDDPFFLVGRSSVPPEHGVFPHADRYLAPEQLQDEMQERKESDIYALALIMGEVLVGKPVKPGVPLSDQGPFFSPELDDLYIRATATDASARFNSVSLFWDTVRQVFRLPAEEFGPGRTPSAFLPEGYSQRAREARASVEAFPFAPTQTTVFQAVVLPPGVGLGGSPVSEAVAERTTDLGAPKVEAPPVVEPPAEVPVERPMEQEAERAAGGDSGDKEVGIDLPVVTAESGNDVEVAAVEEAIGTAEAAEAADVADTGAEVDAGGLPAMELLEEEPAQLAEAAVVLVPEVVTEGPVEEASGVELEPATDEEEAELMAMLEREAALEAGKAVGQDELLLVAASESGELEAEVDMAEVIPAGEASAEPLELESPLPPEVPVGASGAVADESILAEIERIIEESRELDSVIEKMELSAKREGLVPLDAVKASEALEERGEALGESGSGAGEGGDVVEVEAELLEGEGSGEVIDEAEEVDEVEAMEELELEEGDDSDLEGISSGGQALESGELELVESDGDATVVGPPPRIDPVCLAPEKGFRRDLEYWSLRNIEEDSDLEEVMGAVVAAAARKDDEDDDLLVLGGAAKTKKVEDDGLVVELGGEPQVRPEVEKSKGKGKGKGKDKGKEAGEKPKKATEERPAVVVAPAAPPPALERPVGQGAKVVAPPASSGGNKWIWIVVVLVVLAGASVLIATQTELFGTKKQEVAAEKAKQEKAAEDAKIAAQKQAKEAAEREAKAKALAEQAERARLEAVAKAAQAEAEAKALAEKRAIEAAKKEQEQKAAAEQAAAEAEAKKLESAKALAMQALAPTVASAERLGIVSARVADRVAEIEKRLAQLDGLEEKEKARQAALMESLTGFKTSGQEAVKAAAKASQGLEQARELIKSAATFEETGKVDASRLAAIQADQLAALSAGGVWLVQWREMELEEVLAALAAESKKLSAKGRELSRAKAEKEAATVADLSKRLGERLSPMDGEKKAALTEDKSNWEGELQRLDALDAEVRGYAAEVAAALELKAPEVAEEEPAGTQEVATPLTPEEAAEAKKKEELAKLDKAISSQLSQLKKQQEGLKKKADEWKKASDSAKEKENRDLALETEKAVVALQDVSKLSRGGDFDNAKQAFDVVKGPNGQLLSQGGKLLSEKVAGAATESSGSDSAVTPGDDVKKTCPGGMKLMTIKGKGKGATSTSYCIDYYEFPGAGSKPKVNVSWEAANAACAAQGKRLCKKAEWSRACGGKYPYGSTYDPEKCNTMGADGMDRPVVATGSKSGCRSPYGLYDMVGNVAEWVQEKSVAGGDSAKGGEDATCYKAASRFGASPTVGFRCCADPK